MGGCNGGEVDLITPRRVIVIVFNREVMLSIACFSRFMLGVLRSVFCLMFLLSSEMPRRDRSFWRIEVFFGLDALVFR